MDEVCTSTKQLVFCSLNISWPVPSIHAFIKQQVFLQRCTIATCEKKFLNIVPPSARVLSGSANKSFSFLGSFHMRLAISLILFGLLDDRLLSLAMTSDALEDRGLPLSVPDLEPAVRLPV